MVHSEEVGYQVVVEEEGLQVVEMAKKYVLRSCVHWSCLSWIGAGLPVDQRSHEPKPALRQQVVTIHVNIMWNIGGALTYFQESNLDARLFYLLLK
jgi:hypothetical protein